MVSISSPTQIRSDFCIEEVQVPWESDGKTRDYVETPPLAYERIFPPFSLRRSQIYIYIMLMN